MAASRRIQDPLAQFRVTSPDNPPPAAEDLSISETIEPTQTVLVEDPRAVRVATSLPPTIPIERFKVTAKRTISWGSQMVTFHPGDVISEESHGPSCVDKMRDAGVELVMID